MSRTATPSSHDSLLKGALWYTAAAGAVFGLTAAEAEAQVVYTDVDPDVTLVDGDFPVDFDGDSDPELLMREVADLSYCLTNQETALGADNITGVVANVVAGYTYFLPLSANATISAGNQVPLARIFQTFTYAGADPNSWLGTDAYAGVRFILDGVTHFGWISVEIPPAGGAMIIKEFAYEATPDTPIAAGDMGTVAIEPGPDGLPGTHNLSPVYPNPFNPRASFSLEIAQAQHVRVEVFSALGQRVATLHDGVLSAGSAHAFALDGAALTSGVYLVRATGEHFDDTRQVTLLK